MTELIVLHSTIPSSAVCMSCLFPKVATAVSVAFGIILQVEAADLTIGAAYAHAVLCSVGFMLMHWQGVLWTILL